MSYLTWAAPSVIDRETTCPNSPRRPALELTAMTGSRRPSPGRIDTHHHAVPPRMREWAIEQGVIPPTGGPARAHWTLPSTLETMDANGIAVGVASAPVPAQIFADRSRPAAFTTASGRPARRRAG
ncbi:hypothetical protein GCM10010182_59890 [Actinomadura cremea]|nr:hypothetical protein GCM10010182_59890 [Actinomadura cremea]